MGQIFDAGEIFEMAIRMEQNGAAFYRKAAEGISETQNHELLLALAKMEDQHEITFSTLRQELSAAGSDYYDPAGEAAGYLKSIVNTRIFFKREIDVSAMDKILKEAILAEQEAIIFYLGLKELVQSDLGKDKVQEIIKEEMSHVRLLSEKLTELKKGAA